MCAGRTTQPETITVFGTEDPKAGELLGVGPLRNNLAVRANLLHDLGMHYGIQSREQLLALPCGFGVLNTLPP